jgi:hypothetical protein
MKIFFIFTLSLLTTLVSAQTIKQPKYTPKYVPCDHRCNLHGRVNYNRYDYEHTDPQEAGMALYKAGNQYTAVKAIPLVVVPIAFATRQLIDDKDNIYTYSILGAGGLTMLYLSFRADRNLRKAGSILWFSEHGVGVSKKF